MLSKCHLPELDYNIGRCTSDIERMGVEHRNKGEPNRRFTFNALLSISDGLSPCMLGSRSSSKSEEWSQSFRSLKYY